MSLRGAVGDEAIMSLRGDEVPAATSYINVRLLHYVRNDPCLIVRLLRAKALAMTTLCYCKIASAAPRNDREASLRGGRSPTKQSCHCEGMKSPRQPHLHYCKIASLRSQ